MSDINRLPVLALLGTAFALGERKKWPGGRSLPGRLPVNRCPPYTKGDPAALPAINY